MRLLRGNITKEEREQIARDLAEQHEKERRHKEILATYNLVLTGPTTPIVLASLPLWLAEAEENLNDLLPPGYAVRIIEWSSDEHN